MASMKRLYNRVFVNHLNDSVYVIIRKINLP